MKFKNILLPGRISSNRIFYLDFLKDFAIFLVIVGHVSSQTLLFSPINANWIIADFYSTFAKISIPIFIMISGVLLLNKDYDFIGFVEKRFKRILIPFLFWGSVYVIFSFKFGFVEGVSPDYSSIFSIGSFIVSMFLGRAGYLTHFWYVWMILSVYLIAPVVNKWIKNSDFKEVEYFLIIWLITSVFTSFKLPYINFDLRYFAGPLGYFILGYYLHNKNSKILQNNKLWFLVLIVSTLIKVFLVYHNSLIAGSFQSVDRFGLTTVAEAVSLFLLFKNYGFNSDFMSNIPKSISTGKSSIVILSLSLFTYGIYLSHLLLFKYLLICHVSFASMNALVSIPLLSVGFLFVAWVSMIILSKIPFLNRFTGVV
jgi:surface polysaccharide O-acyltransferase-like enzyme